MRHPDLDEVEDPASNFREPGIAGGEVVELISVQDQELDLLVVEYVVVQDRYSDDVADDVDWPVMIATHPSQPEIVSVRISPHDLETGKVALCQPLEVQIVEDVALDHKLVAVVH